MKKATGLQLTQGIRLTPIKELSDTLRGFGMGPRSTRDLLDQLGVRRVWVGSVECFNWYEFVLKFTALLGSEGLPVALPGSKPLRKYGGVDKLPSIYTGDLKPTISARKALGRYLVLRSLGANEVNFKVSKMLEEARRKLQMEMGRIRERVAHLGEGQIKGEELQDAAELAFKEE